MTADPYTDGFQADPYPHYATLRADAPVHRVPGRDVWMVSAADLVRRVLRDPATFSSEAPSGRRAEPPAEVADEVAALRAQGHAYQPALGLSDGARHVRFRRLVQRAFTPRSIGWMDPVVDRIARELVDALPLDEPVDLVEALARPLPIYAICRILGLPDSWRDDITRWSDAATASLGSGALDAERFLQTERTMLDYQQALVPEFERRRAHPSDDLLSVIVATDPELGALADGELLWLVRELLVAGNETTTKLVSEIVRCLDGRPDEWRRVRDEDGHVARVVEEGLRFASPVQGMFRRVTAPTTLGEVDLPAGATVFVAFASANRDETLFDDPDVFDADRDGLREHLAFGHGVHVCLGNALARMEAAVALRELARRADRIDVVDPAALRYTPSFVLRGLLTLPVRVIPR